MKSATAAKKLRQSTNRGVRRSWLAIGLLTTCIVVSGPDLAFAENVIINETVNNSNNTNDTSKNATVGNSTNAANKPVSFWAQSKEARTEIRRQRRARIDRVRELKDFEENLEYHTMFDESFELLFRGMEFSMSMSPVS